MKRNLGWPRSATPTEGIDEGLLGWPQPVTLHGLALVGAFGLIGAGIPPHLNSRSCYAIIRAKVF